MSKASMASIRPKTPAEIRSSSSTPSGKRAQIRSPLYFTRGRYCSTSRLRSSWLVGSALYRFQTSSISSCFSTVNVAMPSSVMGLPSWKGSSTGYACRASCAAACNQLSSAWFRLGLLLLFRFPSGHRRLELGADRFVHQIFRRLAGEISHCGEREHRGAGRQERPFDARSGCQTPRDRQGEGERSQNAGVRASHRWLGAVWLPSNFPQPSKLASARHDRARQLSAVAIV